VFDQLDCTASRITAINIVAADTVAAVVDILRAALRRSQNSLVSALPRVNSERFSGAAAVSKTFTIVDGMDRSEYFSTFAINRYRFGLC
jgi:hypothetical protein